NDKNDSTIVGLSATNILGNSSESPMSDIQNLTQVIRNDSTNVFALTVLGYGAMMTRQYDKAIERFGKVATLQPNNLEAILKLAEVYEIKADTANAIKWYSNALEVPVNNPNMKTALEQRVKELKK